MKRLLVLACALALPLAADTLTYVNRSGAAEQRLTLRRERERLVLVDDDSRAIVASAPAASTDRVAIEGAGGASRDSLTIDLAQPIALARGIDYDGGDGGWDVLALTGGSARRQTVTQLTPHDGIIDIDGLVIRYSNLEPITDTAPAANYTINGTAGADEVTVSDGPGGTTTVSSPTFESVTFANKINVVYDGMGGGDGVLFNNPNPATGLVSFIATDIGSASQTADVRYSFFGISATGEAVFTRATNDVSRVELTVQNGNVLFIDANEVMVGGVSPALAGIRAVQSGSAGVQALGGSVILADADGAEIIKAGDTAGDVTVYAAGPTSDIIATANSMAIVAPAGSGYIQAGRDITLGTAGPGFANDVRLATYGSLTAGGTVTIGGNTLVTTGGLPPHLGAALIVLGQNVIQLDAARFVAGGATGGDLDILALQDISFLGTVTAAESQSGDVLILPRHFVLAPASGVSAPAGRVTITSEGVDLGTVADVPGGAIELSDAELDRVTATVVNIRSSSEPLRVTAPITFSGAPELVLTTGRYVTAVGAGSLSAATLTFDINNETPYVWTITPTTVQMTGGTPVPYSGVVLLNANSSAPYPSGLSFPTADTLLVMPSATTTIHVDGNLPTPPASPGDTLDFDLAGVVNPVLTATLTPDGYQGTLTSANRQPVTFEHIETLVDAPVDLSVTKTDNAATVPAGAPVTYTITVTNPAPIPVANAAVADTFPLANFTWTCTASPGSSCAAAGTGNLNDVVTLAANGGTVTYTATGTTAPSDTGILTNTATVTTPAGYVETNPANNSATDTTTLTAEADLIVTKSTTTQMVFPEEPVTYTITLRNAGPSDAQNVVLTDAIPAGTTIVAFEAAPGYTCTTAGTITCTRSVLPPSPTADVFTLTLRVSAAAVAEGATVTNTVTVTSSTIDPAPGDNVATAVVATAIPIPSLSLGMLLALAGLLAVVGVIRAMV